MRRPNVFLFRFGSSFGCGLLGSLRRGIREAQQNVVQVDPPIGTAGVIAQADRGDEV